MLRVSQLHGFNKLKGGDPYWANVFLLLNGQSTLLKDASSYNRTLNYDGTPTLDSSLLLFGFPTYNISDGVRERITIASDAFFATEFGSGEWSIEYWVRPSSAGSDHRFCSFSKFELRWFPEGYFGAVCTSIGGASKSMSQLSGEAPSGAWYHVAFVRDNVTDPTFTILRLFVDGVQKAESGGISKASTIGTGDGFGWLVGYNENGAFGNFSNVRITKGIARYRADFTPPTAPFPNS